LTLTPLNIAGRRLVKLQKLSKTVHVHAILGEALRFVDAHMAVATHIDQAVVARLSVGDEQSVQRDVTPDNRP
jgi:hypothetical protein